LIVAAAIWLVGGAWISVAWKLSASPLNAWIVLLPSTLMFVAGVGFITVALMFKD
jgi:hypothetical protein